MAKKPREKIGGVSFEEFTSRIKKTDLNTYFIFGAIILVLIVGIYALFSPEAQNLKSGNPACGKIVIAADGPRLSNNVARSLPEARFFLVVDPLSKKLSETIRNPYPGLKPNPQIVYLIAGKGEEAVIVGSIDQQSYNTLMQFGIRVFGGYEGQARKVLSLYRQARISQIPPAEQAPQASQAGPQALQPSQAAFGFGQMPFNCPNCNWQVYARMDRDSAYPQCPNCKAILSPNGIMQTGDGPVYGMGMNQGFGMGAQAAFGWGQQDFICPNCNWRLKAARQGNDFPTCPNCNSPMALDKSNKPWKWWSDGQWAADMTRLRPQMNQMTNQPNFWQGPESTGFFICPSCNWRMYSQKGLNEYPTCPNCGQLMARGGALPQNQDMQNQDMQNQYTGNPYAGAQVSLQAPVTAPAITMPHPYRGECSSCHQIIGAQAGAQAGAQSGQGSTRVTLGQAQNQQ